MMVQTDLTKKRDPISKITRAKGYSRVPALQVQSPVLYPPEKKSTHQPQPASPGRMKGKATFEDPWNHDYLLKIHQQIPVDTQPHHDMQAFWGRLPMGFTSQSQYL
jgi:hypothetical protein